MKMIAAQHRLGRLLVVACGTALLALAPQPSRAQGQCATFQEQTSGPITDGSTVCATASGNNKCTFQLELCVNQSGNSCTPKDIIRASSLCAGGIGKVNVKANGTSSVCGSFVGVRVKTKKHGRKTGSCKIHAKAGQSRSTITLLCLPAGSTCSGTTTTLPSTPTTTLPSTPTTTLPPRQCHSDFDCQDGNLCNGLETCVAGTCVPGNPALCSNGVPALWLGTATSASGGYLNVGMTLCAVGAALTGQFACEPGTNSCLATQGTITGTIAGSDAYYPRVAFPDGSYCYFGGLVSGLTLSGTPYTCYDASGSVLLDSGSYSVTRCP